MPRISSTSCITGTGFMKWMPMKRSGRSVEAARRVMEMDGGLVARMESGRSTGRSSAKMRRFTSSFSDAASLRSLRRTSRPASAQTWAMPLPIWPAPITPTVLMSVVIARAPSARFRARLAEFLVEFRQEGEQVADEAVIRDLEDRGLLVLVDRHDDLGVLHAGQMLDRPRDADRDVEVRRHHLARLAHLPVVRGVARVHRRPARAHGGAELVGDRLDVPREVLRRL